MGALSAVGSAVVDSLPGTVSISKASCGGHRLVPHRNPAGRSGRVFLRTGELSSAFLDCWSDWRVDARAITGTVSHRRLRRRRRLVVVSEVAGQYEDSFDDVKAVRLHLVEWEAESPHRTGATQSEASKTLPIAMK